MKTSNLSGVALDWAVAKANSFKIYQVWPDEIRVIDGRNWIVYSPSTDWMQGGPIIEREEIDICHSKSLGAWVAAKQIFDECMVEESPFYGAWALQAAMRCYVASKLGDEIDIPEELK